jgi:endogenous inhibitor of DNA gyrase (YacG/DUF329 family)
MYNKSMIKQCNTCNKTIERQASWFKGKTSFCNKKCHIKYQSTLKGENANNWRGGSYKFICKSCRKPSEKRRNAITPKYCSIKCASDDGAQGVQGDKHWNWKGRMDTRYMRKSAPRPKPTNCEICNAPESNFKKGLQYDHDHNTGKFRGWLCSNCNTALGLVKDNKQILQELIKYLEVNENLL